MTLPSEHTDVLIVGAGPTGLAMAVELARRNVPFEIIERTSAPAANSRALGIQARTLEAFETMGIADEFIRCGVPIRGGRGFSQGREILHFTFDMNDTPFPFALGLPQSQTELILQKHLEKLGHIVHREVSLDHLQQMGDEVISYLRKPDGSEQTCTSRWLIGCDGAHSTVRHGLNLSFEGAEYPEAFVLADVKIAGRDVADEIHVHVSDAGLLVLFTLPGGSTRVVANLSRAETEQDAGDPALEDVQRIVDQRGPGSLQLTDPVWLARFRVHRRMASTFRDGRIFLAGDAAHIHSPAGGQGMNTGIQDAFNLGWKLAAVINGVADEKILDTYNAERLPVARAVLHGTDEATKIITAPNLVTRFIRDHVAPHVMNLEIVQRHLRRELSELAVHYDTNLLVEDDPVGGSLQAGHRAPDGKVQENGQEIQLFSIFQGTHWTLLNFRATDSSEVRSELLEVARQHPQVRFYEVSRYPSSQRPVLLDADGSLHKRYCVEAPVIFLIRPDGYVGLHAPDHRSDLLEQYLSRIFVAPVTAGR